MNQEKLKKQRTVGSEGTLEVQRTVPSGDEGTLEVQRTVPSGDEGTLEVHYRYIDMETLVKIGFCADDATIKSALSNSILPVCILSKNTIEDKYTILNKPENCQMCMSEDDRKKFYKYQVYCEILVNPTPEQISKYKTQDNEEFTFEELTQIIFEDWVKYSPETIEMAKQILRNVCPHEEIVDDYIEVDVERGESIRYCKLCMKLFDF